MSDFVEHAPCENFEANVFAKSRCQNCFRAVGAHHQPSNQVSFLCDLEGYEYLMRGSIWGSVTLHSSVGCQLVSCSQRASHSLFSGSDQPRIMK
uniref:Uncharacterized protein n=1 Tax=Gopherus evgoodei TaxID=1825980 RepID=A0A8C4VD68_9SAUR